MAFNLASKSVLVTRLVTSGILFSTTVNAELLAKPLTSGILFSTAVNAEVVAKLLISEILFSAAVKADFLTKSLTSGIFLSILLILSSKSDPSFSYLILETKFVVSVPFTLATNLSCSVFFTTSFLTTLLNLARSTGTAFSLSIPSLSTSAFKLAKFDFNA